MGSHLLSGFLDAYLVMHQPWPQKKQLQEHLEFNKRSWMVRTPSADSWRSVKRQRWLSARQTVQEGSVQRSSENPFPYVDLINLEILWASFERSDGMDLAASLEKKADLHLGLFMPAFLLWWPRIRFGQRPQQKFWQNNFWIFVHRGSESEIYNKMDWRMMLQWDLFKMTWMYLLWIKKKAINHPMLNCLKKHLQSMKDLIHYHHLQRVTLRLMRFLFHLDLDSIFIILSIRWNKIKILRRYRCLSSRRNHLRQPCQMENEQAPPTPMLDPNFAPPVPDGMSLTTALRRSVSALDGIPEFETPVPTTRTRSRSPLREASRIPIADPMRDRGLFAKKEQWHLHCFLAKRVFKKKRQVGAGREINFDKSTEEIQKKLTATRAKEWNNWKQFNAVRILAPHEQEEFFQQNPETEIIPTRWVDTDKAEAHEESVYKSRLVARGDLEKNNNLRTDSPTSSQLFLNLVISYAACTGEPLKGGDISAAFLQGTGIQRLLALKLPAGGVPDESIEPGSLLLCEKSVYGTRDAPRGFWKGLHDVLLKSGLLPLVYETSAYYLPGPKGKISGLLGCHVDDLLWCGGKEIDGVMEAVQRHYNFRMTSNDVSSSAEGPSAVLQMESPWHARMYWTGWRTSTCPMSADSIVEKELPHRRSVNFVLWLVAWAGTAECADQTWLSQWTSCSWGPHCSQQTVGLGFENQRSWCVLPCRGNGLQQGDDSEHHRC